MTPQIGTKRQNSFYPLLPTYMDSPDNHPEVTVATTKGPCVFVIKCILLGSRFDAGYKLNDVFCQELKKTIENLQSFLKIEIDGNFGQETRNKLMTLIGVNIDDIPYTLFGMSDTALQPDGQSIVWPQGSNIITLDSNQRRTSTGEICLFPPYMDWAGAHSSPMGITQGPSVFILKCLFALTSHFTAGCYRLNTMFCNDFATMLAGWQTSHKAIIDSCFGQDARDIFQKCFGRNLENVPRSVLTGASTAIQPDGSVVAWPPQIIIA